MIPQLQARPSPLVWQPTGTTGGTLEPLTDEEGNTLTDENGNPLYPD